MEFSTVFDVIAPDMTRISIFLKLSGTKSSITRIDDPVQ